MPANYLVVDVSGTATPAEATEALNRHAAAGYKLQHLASGRGGGKLRCIFVMQTGLPRGRKPGKFTDSDGQRDAAIDILR